MIKVSNLHKYFYHRKSNEIHVINDVTLQFPETGLITICGESGSGKTTLMNVIGGLDDFYSGTIEIDDFKIKKYSSKVIDRIRNEKIGYIFQNYLLLQQNTVYENLKIMLNMYSINEKEQNERIDYVLKAVGMLKYKKKKVAELSGGQQQRVAIARALIKSPSLILADEPTGNLDEKNTIQIMNIIKKISQKTLVILVSHEKNIAVSYSDYIIEVEDGKIKSHGNCSGQIKYQYEDDQNLYLKEYKYQKIENDNVEIDFYSNENSKISIQIVCQNGKFFIKSSNDIVLLDNSSEIKMIDDYKKDLDTEAISLENEYELKALDYVKNPKLSFKEKVKLAFSNLAKMKKRRKFLSFPLFIMSVLVLICSHSMVSASFVDRQHLYKEDSRIYNIDFEKADARLDNTIFRFGYEHFYDDLFEEIPEVEPVITIPIKLRFSMPNFEQFNSTKHVLDGFSLMSLEQLDEESIIYGNMATKANEVVVEKWVIDNILEKTTLQNLMDYTSFIGKNVTTIDEKFHYIITGIASNDENTMYFNKWDLINIYPSDMKRDNYSVSSYSEFVKYLGKDKYSIEIGKHQGIASGLTSFPYQTTDLVVNDDERLTIDVIDKIDFEGFPYDFIVSDELYADILKSVMSYNYDTLNIFCENEKEKQRVKEYVDSVKDYYANGDLKATGDNGYVFPGATASNVVKVLINAHSTYDEKMAPYYEQAQKAVASRALITITIILVSVIIVFFSMKSFAIKNIYDIGVYRAIGINKGSIIFVYALEILIISLRTTLIGGALCYLITNVISSIPLISVSFAISFAEFAIATFGLIILNVIVGVIPVSLYLRLTPSKILTKYDV